MYSEIHSQAKFWSERHLGVTDWDKRRACGRRFPFTVLHLFSEEKNQTSQSSKNGPSTIQGESATSSFYKDREWGEGYLTTPTVKNESSEQFLDTLSIGPHT